MRRKRYKRKKLPIWSFFSLVGLAIIIIVLGFLLPDLDIISTYFADTATARAQDYAKNSKKNHYVYYNPAEPSSKIYAEASVPSNEKLDLKEDALVEKKKELSRQDEQFLYYMLLLQWQTGEALHYLTVTPEGTIYPE